MNNRLAEKVAVITGTGRGQGRAAALRFAAEGARVVGCDLDPSQAQETVDAVRRAGGEMVSIHPLDLSDEGQLPRLFALADSEFGGLDVLYNNASALRVGSLAECSRTDFDYTIANELTIVWLATKHALGLFRRRGGGSVINIGSTSGVIGSGTVGNAPDLFAHALAKAAVIRMTEVMAIELGGMGVRVNTISPGIIDTEGSRGILGAEGSEMRAHFSRQLLIPRIGLPDDVVNAAVFLASDEAAYITGVNLMVDGGKTGSGGVGLADKDVLDAMQRALTPPN